MLYLPFNVSVILLRIKIVKYRLAVIVITDRVAEAPVEALSAVKQVAFHIGEISIASGIEATCIVKPFLFLYRIGEQAGEIIIIPPVKPVIAFRSTEIVKQ